MIVYIIQDRGYQYNDSYFIQPECGSGSAVSVYLDEGNALKECRRMNNIRRKENKDYAFDMSGSEIREWFEVIEMDVADAEVE